ncbi:OPT oligopeptide transporter protein-domain-containing protein [Kockovaella imperatae]|uniref:OPT oligopeptide transporter protein-domain-containing protein n=1 Tax=Kockovaella imperatae TaxID=4999 RepID=A0A1Y1URY4_9TREE|nr:OPT oligopeptide transporter protein-domain-containing protein [Kockovaella imperatae]ORX40798.1 OPT oligopeptide transporter protein-domain-containing protein [Kockovaella imperatae]
MSNLEELDKTGVYKLETPTLDETLNEKDNGAPQDWYERLKDEYSGHHELESLPPGCDPDRFAVAIFTMDENQSAECLANILNNLHNDYTFDLTQVARMRELIAGPESCGLAHEEWAYQVCKMAGIFHNWSAYLEVRAVTLPYDNVEEPCETFRAYLVGFFWVLVMTAVNTFFAPRQPGIGIPNQVAQLLCVPMGRGLATILPKWGFSIRGHRYEINSHHPWSAKEQLFTTIIFSGSTSYGNFTGLLDMRMPIFFGQKWATYGFCLLVAVSNQCFGMGMAGILRRLTVYPTEAVWPGNLPTIALTRALVSGENKNEVINGWKLRRLHMFGIVAVIFGIYYWIPNELFGAIRNFNWMTWISPQNFTLAVVTGGFGGLGFNPISSLDPSTFGFLGGGQGMSAPFFAQLQQYVLRIFGGIVILALYFSNSMWGAYLPINSNGVFDNKGQNYNYTKVINADSTVNLDGYKDYGPPYYTTSNLFVTGGNFVYYTFSIVYVFVKYRYALKKCFVGMVVNTWKRRSIYTGFTDGATRMMRKYPEVPEWWYSILFACGFVTSICSVAAFPTTTPWWSIFGLVGVGFVLTIPYTIIQSVANTGINLGVIWQVLPGVWFPGKPIAQLMLLMYGGAFEQEAGGFTADLKYAMYARIPPRAIFRGHLVAQVVNCIIYVAMIDVMLAYANATGTLCQYDNPQFMVCAYAHSVYSSTIAFGAFGTNNMFKLYPVIPYCFVIGAVLGVMWIVGESYGPKIHVFLEKRMHARSFTSFDRYVWTPCGNVLAYVHPAIAINGMLQWSGNNGLTQATQGIMLTWFFQFWLKRRYSAFWQKYAYLIWAGMAVGATISGLIITLVFSFGAGSGKELKWWGNEVQKDGIDYALYNNKGSYLPLPERGYFGLEPQDFPTNW